MISGLPELSSEDVVSYRVINAKYPPIHIFDDVADPQEFEALYHIQALTNPRLKAEVGNLALLPLEDIPFGIAGCSYATAPFAHVNPDGSRFSDGSYGLLYSADSQKTALTEVKHHQTLYWSNVPELHFDRFIFRVLTVTFDIVQGIDLCRLAEDDPIYDSECYVASRQLGQYIKEQSSIDTLRYRSVRDNQGVCYAVLSPRHIQSVIQGQCIEMIWHSGKLSDPITIVNA